MSKEWFVHFQKQQSGPFSEVEIQEQLKNGKLSAQAFLWKASMADWQRAGEIFKATAATQIPSPVQTPKPQERRKLPRRPFLARLFGTDESYVLEGLCADLSSGGMKVLTEAIPPPPGTRLKFNVSPVGSVGENFSPFVAVGQVVRVFKNGFSIQFTDIPVASRDVLAHLLSDATRERASGRVRKAS